MSDPILRPTSDASPLAGVAAVLAAAGRSIGLNQPDGSGVSWPENARPALLASFAHTRPASTSLVVVPTEAQARALAADLRCFLGDDAARMLGDALGHLQRGHPGWTFVMYDCARPRRVQLIMWDVVKGTKQQGYVANPHTPPGSIHNTGCAVDLSVWDATTSSAVDMGTPYDFFGSAAHPSKESELWKSGGLTSAQWANRLALREAMLRAGFRPLGHEWWHFDCADGKTARRKYPVIP